MLGKNVASILRYLLAGGSAFVLDFALLYAFKSLVGLPAWIAAAIAFVISTIFAFYAQKIFTFASRVPSGPAMVRYGVLLAANTAFTAVIVQGFDTFLGLYLVGKVVSAALTTGWNYPLMRLWVYHHRTASLPPPQTLEVKS